MKVAVTIDQNGNIFQHFGRSEQFKVYEIENNEVVSESVESTNGEGHGALSGVLFGLGADILICGGIGPGAQNHLKEANIKIYGGLQGSADEAVQAFLKGELSELEKATCDHHHGEHSCGGHGHHGEHGCGGHGHHGEHGCGGHGHDGEHSCGGCGRHE